MGTRLVLTIAAAISLFSLDLSAQRRNGNNYGGITVYESPDFRGGAVTFRGEIPDLREYRLNDRITSLEIVGNRAWEVCRDVFFNGACHVFTGSIDDLREVGWNDRISSLRPLGNARDGGAGWGNIFGNRNGNANATAGARALESVAPGALRSRQLPRRVARRPEQQQQPWIGRRSRPQRRSRRGHLGTLRRQLLELAVHHRRP